MAHFEKGRWIQDGPEIPQRIVEGVAGAKIKAGEMLVIDPGISERVLKYRVPPINPHSLCQRLA